MEKTIKRDFSGGPMVKNSPANAGDLGSIPDLGTKIPTYSEPTKPTHATTTEAHCALELEHCNKRSHCNEKTTHYNKE